MTPEPKGPPVVSMRLLFLNKLLGKQIAWPRWAGRAFWAVVDQALFAGANFFLGVLLARLLEPAAYGAFSTVYSIFLLVGTAHSALWIEPMLVYGAGRYQDGYASYQQVLLSSHWRFSFVIFLLFLSLGGVFLLFGQFPLGVSFLGLAVAAPLNLYLWLMRRSTYVLLEPQISAYAGLLYLVLLLGVIAGMSQFGLLNEGSALIAMGIAGLFAGSRIQRRVYIWNSQTLAIDPVDVYKTHWNYGRWALLASLLLWVPGNIYFLILPIWWGLEATATLKALMNLIMPILHFNNAIAGLFVPTFVRKRAEGRLARAIVQALYTQLVPAVSFWILLFYAGVPLIHWVYGGKYEGGRMLVWLGLLAVTSSVVNTYSSALRAVERPDLVTRVYASTAVASLSVGVGLVYVAGITGAIVAITGINAVTAVLFALLGTRWTKRAN